MPLTPAHTAAQVTRTLDEIHEWRPVLDPVLHAFAPCCAPAPTWRPLWPPPWKRPGLLCPR